MTLARSQKDVAAITAPGVYRFSRGLFLQVTGPQAKSWIYRFTLKGQPRWRGLGSARDVTLAQARAKLDDLRVNKVLQGVDPNAEDDARAAAERAAKAQAVPFRERAEQYIAAHTDGWKNDKHRAQWRSTLDAYAMPTIGDVPANEVTASHIVDILRPIWTEKAETARRLRGRIETILDYAANPDDVAWRNPAAMTAQLAKKLPKASRNKQRKHHASLAYEELGAFLLLLQEREGTAARALEFLILTAARTGEVILARWGEIDIAQRLWTIPGERMKSGREHRVPLSPRAVEILQALPQSDDFVFPGPSPRKPMSNMAMLALLHRMGRADITAHGFRSTFRTWAGEQTNFPREVAEAALAHVLEDATEAAYQRGDLLDKRRRLMEAWASYCAKPAASAKVLKLR